MVYYTSYHHYYGIVVVVVVVAAAAVVITMIKMCKDPACLSVASTGAVQGLYGWTTYDAVAVKRHLSTVVTMAGDVITVVIMRMCQFSVAVVCYTSR